jgi:hypothetical protein
MTLQLFVRSRWLALNFAALNKQQSLWEARDCLPVVIHVLVGKVKLVNAINPRIQRACQA